MQNLQNLQNKIGIEFKNIELYETAMTHRSYINENKKIKEHNERLEFLWDAVLELSITKFLFNKYPQFPEWKLTSFRSSLVKKETLAFVWAKLWLWKLLKLSKWEDKWWWRTSAYLLANTVEALIWAIYLDLWFDITDKFIVKFIWEELETVIKTESFIDPKWLIQAFTQAKLKNTPTYKIIKESWPDHEKTFIVWVYSLDSCIWIWKWGSKQLAQQNSAQNACEKFWLK